MKTLDVKILDPRLRDALPQYSTAGAAGLDLRACVEKPLELAPGAAELVPSGIEAIEVPARNQLVRMALRLPLLMRKLQPQLVHFQHALPLGYSGPSALTVHDLSFQDPELMRLRDRVAFRAVPRSAQRASRVLVVSEGTKRDLVERCGISAEKIVVTPNGVGQPFGPEGPHADGRPYALVVGSLEPRKDPVTAVESLALLGRDELRLVFAGPDRGDGAATLEAATRHGLERRVELKGHVSPEELAALYRGAACLVFPSRHEGFGLPPLESDTKRETFESFSRIDWTPSTTNHVTGAAMVSPRKTTYAGLNTFNPQPVTPDIKNHNLFVTASDHAQSPSLKLRCCFTDGHSDAMIENTTVSRRLPSA